MFVVLPIGVYASGIEAEVTFEDNSAIISGFVNGNKKPSEVSLLVGDVEDIIYIDQISSDENGNFTFKVPFDKSYPKGMYPYAIGSDVGSGKFEGIIDYKGYVTYLENKFLTSNLNVSVINYVPSITGTISCTEGKSVNITVTNTTNNTIISQETINSQNGEYQISYTLPSLINWVEYSVEVIVNSSSSQQVLLNMTVDSAILLVEASGTVFVEIVTMLTSGDGGGFYSIVID